MTGKSAYLILTRGSKNQYAGLLSDLSDSKIAQDNLFILLDNNDGSEYPDDKRIIPFTKEKLETLNLPFYRGGNVGFGNTHLPLFYFAQQRPEFEHFWLIEDDVRFTGSFDTFFNDLNQYPHDFISAKIKHYQEMPDFFMWDWMSRHDSPVPGDQKLWSFNPFYRISRTAIVQLSKAYEEGWLGHFEILIPTLIHHYGLSMMDFGGNNEYTPKELINRYYEQGYKLKQTHRYRPPHLLRLRRNKIYHPVKPLKQTLPFYWRMIVLKWRGIIRG